MSDAADFAHERIRLIMQLRKTGISDAVLGAIERIPRELFVGEENQLDAYRDEPLEIACGQTISQPQIVGLMTDKLELTGREHVLEIGTGSGYQAAILSLLARRVHTVERHRALHEAASARFIELKLTNIVAHHADGTKGWPLAGPYDRILVTAATKETPRALLEQLREGGILIIPIDTGDYEKQELRRIRKTADGITQEMLTHVRFVPLVDKLPSL